MSKAKCMNESPVDLERTSRVLQVKCSRVIGHKGDHTYHQMSDEGTVVIWSWK